MKNAEQIVRDDAEEVLAAGSSDLNSLRNRHIFISGGTGILGKWLLELISILNENQNYEIRVTILSRNPRNFITLHPRLGKLPWLNLLEGDIRHISELPGDVSHIIHAAALTDRRLFASQPTTVAEINAFGTLRLLRAANLLEDVEKFVLISSGLVYGNQPWEKTSISETFVGSLRSNDVNSVYPESKRFAETIAQCAMSESKLPIVTLRPFAFVGPYQSLNLPWAVTDFIRDSLGGGPIRIMGDGTSVRSLMYVSDFAYWVLSATALGKARETYNIGSPEAIDLHSLARIITSNFNPAPPIHKGVGQTGHERNRLVPDVSLAMQNLGVKITVPIGEAIRRSVDCLLYTSPSPRDH
jgi:nucleoside-diphosphate-sugar epimerase